ncbi:hypothetical protein PINS_up012997 [Pythium insidiosum]|nr:hypothetical protein PINS_up012997 [Pythium insidiosum]
MPSMRQLGLRIVLLPIVLTPLLVLLLVEMLKPLLQLPMVLQGVLLLTTLRQGMLVDVELLLRLLLLKTRLLLVVLVVEMQPPLLRLKMLLLALHPGQVTMDPVTMTKLHPQLAVNMHPQRVSKMKQVTETHPQRVLEMKRVTETQPLRVSEMKRVTETQPTMQPTTSITIAEAKIPKQTLSVVLGSATPTQRVAVALATRTAYFPTIMYPK